MTALELVDRAITFRRLGAAAHMATLRSVVADAAFELEHSPVELLAGFERLEREISGYLGFVELARALNGSRCAL